jgi:hypothetical protein
MPKDNRTYIETICILKDIPCFFALDTDFEIGKCHWQKNGESLELKK